MVSLGDTKIKSLPLRELMFFNRDHLLRNAAWDCLAREHYGRRDGRESALLCFDRDN
jgi:hypothetical protein